MVRVFPPTANTALSVAQNRNKLCTSLLCLLVIVLHYALTLRLCQSYSEVSIVFGKIIGISGSILCLLTILLYVDPLLIIPTKWNTLLYGNHNALYCIFMLEIYGIILLNDNRIIDNPPHRWYVFLIPLYFIIQSCYLVNNGSGRETNLLIILSIIYLLDYIDDYLYRIKRVTSKIWHRILWVLILILMGIIVLNLVPLLIGAGFMTMHGEATVLFHIHSFWIGLPLIIVLCLGVARLYQFIPFFTRSNSNAFWSFINALTYCCVAMELFEIFMPSGIFTYWILSFLTFAFGCPIYVTQRSRMHSRCPNCHSSNYENYENTTEGEITTTTTDTDEFDHREEQRDRIINWYRTRRTMVVEQKMVHHYRCKDCGETWEHTSTVELSRRSRYV